MKMKKEFIYHQSQLPSLGVCGYRFVYYEIGRKWVWYRDDPVGFRHRMKKVLFMSILEQITVERIEGYSGKDI